MRVATALALTVICGACTSGCPNKSITRAKNTPPAPQRVGVRLERVFPRLTFARPVLLTHAPGDPGHVYVLEQAGLVQRVDLATGSKTEFLDIRSRVTRAGNEEGLLGLAFHPQYASNKRVFIHYSQRPGPLGVVAELRAPDGKRIDAESEKVLLTQEQPWRNHNGGSVEFGPDGYLYIAFGDGGSGGDPKGAGQDLGTWLGKILRIDVDTPDGWTAPADNPFVGRAGAKAEIWALGLRNPWRISFDRVSGTLWTADVGQDAYEEVDIIERGGNYGWNAFEGSSRFSRDALSVTPHTPPVAIYGRNEGKSITGGYVYRGRDLPLLQGVYVFGDFQSGAIWGLEPTGGGDYARKLLIDSRLQVASFGEDAAGELYVCDFEGAIHRVVADDREPMNITPLARHLSKTGLFADVPKHQPVASAVAYEVNAELWSDGADKTRFFVLPEGTAIDFGTPWVFPEGAAIVKTFQLDGGGETRRLETRVIRREGDFWQAASYVWNEAQTDATIAPNGATIPVAGPHGSSWRVPSKNDCRSCHTSAAGFVLGLETVQVNRDGQLQAWIDKGLLRGVTPAPSSLPALARPDDDAAPLEARARAYLHANCAQCHRPTGPGNASIDLRWNTALDETNMVGVEPAQGDLGLSGARIVAAGLPEASTLLVRMRKRETGAMPPLGSAVHDARGAELLREWIASLP